MGWFSVTSEYPRWLLWVALLVTVGVQVVEAIVHAKAGDPFELAFLLGSTAFALFIVALVWLCLRLGRRWARKHGLEPPRYFERDPDKSQNKRS